MPKITLSYRVNQQEMIEIKIKNETQRTLGCYVAIDGYKARFKLMAQVESPWYAATDKRFKYTDFSVVCDYIAYAQ